MSESNVPSGGEPTVVPNLESRWRPLEERHRNYFLMSGITFLIGSLLLYFMVAYFVYIARGFEIGVATVSPDGGSRSLSDREMANYIGRLVSVFLAPLLTLIAAMICTGVGVRLLRSSGAVTAQVIAPQDYPILGPAIAAGNQEAVTQFIRLSSLTGVTGTFTKIGLTGLPLATIFLTIFLALAGQDDLAKLTLGAFLGSYVQRQTDATKPVVERAGRQ